LTCILCDQPGGQLRPPLALPRLCEDCYLGILLDAHEAHAAVVVPLGQTLVEHVRRVMQAPTDTAEDIGAPADPVLAQERVWRERERSFSSLLAWLDQCTRVPGSPDSRAARATLVAWRFHVLVRRDCLRFQRDSLRFVARKKRAKPGDSANPIEFVAAISGLDLVWRWLWVNGRACDALWPFILLSCGKDSCARQALAAALPILKEVLRDAAVHQRVAIASSRAGAFSEGYRLASIESLAGWACTQISIKRNSRLRAALASEVLPTTGSYYAALRKRLRERLPDKVFEAAANYRPGEPLRRGKGALVSAVTRELERERPLDSHQLELERRRRKRAAKRPSESPNRRAVPRTLRRRAGRDSFDEIFDVLASTEPSLEDFVLREEARSEFVGSLRRVKLTGREMQITELRAESMRPREIAAELGIAVNTVYVHLHNAANKLKLARSA
jgi:DNA-binding CsgD family transcriptional regulator